MGRDPQLALSQGQPRTRPEPAPHLAQTPAGVVEARHDGALGLVGGASLKPEDFCAIAAEAAAA